MDNLEKNTYAKDQITKAFLKLLEKKSIEDIPISKITEKAGVSRMTFYRNYADKPDILRQKLKQLIEDGWAEYQMSDKRSDEYFFGSLFGHFKKNKKFYQILFKSNLDYLLLEHIVDIAGPKPDFDNKRAYYQAYFAYGLYGWIREWVARGMQEGAEEMTALLAKKADADGALS